MILLYVIGLVVRNNVTIIYMIFSHFSQRTESRKRKIKVFLNAFFKISVTFNNIYNEMIVFSTI